MPIFFLMVVLKIPVGLLLYIVWWALHAHTLPEEAPADEDGDHRHRRFRRSPTRPRGPRRGPHAPAALPVPATRNRERAIAVHGGRKAHARRS